MINITKVKDSPCKLRICIVEDELAIQQMYQFRLEHAGFTVATASNGEEGLALIESFKPDLVLLDLRMPIMGGEEMLRRLRSEAWGIQVKIIILTNISRDEAPQSLRFLHVDRYVVKAHHTPRQISELVQEVLAG